MFATFSKKLTTVFKEISEMILMLSLLINENFNLAFLFNFGFYLTVFSTEKFIYSKYQLPLFNAMSVIKLFKNGKL